MSAANTENASKHVERVNLSQTEFIALAATLMSVVALAIDIMLPVLPDIAGSFGETQPNHRQYVITYFSIAFGVGHLFFGPLCDWLGRRIVLISCLAIYTIAPLLSLFAEDYQLFLLLRAVQGVAAAGVRVGVMAVVRDCFAGRQMASVMSFVFMVFMIIPVIAPTIGQTLASLIHWQTIFVLLGVFGCVVGAWVISRLRESIHEEHRVPLSFANMKSSFIEIVTNRISLGYTLASTCFLGALMTFLNASQQIFVDFYGVGDNFPFIFAFVATIMAVAAVTNGKLVGKLGMRRMGHGALLAFTVFGGILSLWSLGTTPPLVATILLLAAAMFSFGLVTPNFNAIAMEPLGHIAGMAAAIIGFITFTGGALLGMIIGQSFNGTMTPIAVGFFLLGVSSLIFVLMTEKGKLFQNPSA